MKELLPGQLSYPYHYHSNNEEVFIIIEGEVTLRQNDKKKILKKGDLVFFSNSREKDPISYSTTQIQKSDIWILTTRFGIDICKYPDSKKTSNGIGYFYRIKE